MKVASPCMFTKSSQIHRKPLAAGKFENIMHTNATCWRKAMGSNHTCWLRINILCV